MKYLILEDEKLAADELIHLLGYLRPQWQLAEVIDSVEHALEVMPTIKADLIFSDIRLSDGLCFELFQQLDLDTPIVFTTAYDEYVLKAFKQHSIDYLLKPIEEAELKSAIEKFERHFIPGIGSRNLQYASQDYTSQLIHNRFLVSIGDRYTYVCTQEICCFFSEDKYNYVLTLNNRKLVIGYSLDQLVNMLDPKQFCRVSRNCIVSIKGVKHFSRYFAGRLRLELEPSCPVEVVVSRSRVDEVLAWLNDETSL